MLYSIRHYDGSDLGLKTLYFRREIPLIPSCLGPPAHLSQTAAHENLSALMLYVEHFPISVWMCVCVYFSLTPLFLGSLTPLIICTPSLHSASFFAVRSLPHSLLLKE